MLRYILKPINNLLLNKPLILPALLFSNVNHQHLQEFLHPTPRPFITGLERFICDYRKYGVNYASLDPLDLAFKEEKFPLPDSYGL